MGSTEAEDLSGITGDGSLVLNGYSNRSQNSYFEENEGGVKRWRRPSLGRRLLRDNIDTDQIYPGRYLEPVDPVARLAGIAWPGLIPRSHRILNPRGIVVAGRNFGCGVQSGNHVPLAPALLWGPAFGS